MHRKRTIPTLLLALCLGLAACGGGGEEPPEEWEEQEVCYPVRLNGVEIRVGETTVQALLDAGVQITVSDGNYSSVEVDPETMLEAETYYSAG